MTYILVGPAGYAETACTIQVHNILLFTDRETQEVKEREERKKADHHDQNNTLLNPTGTLLSTLRGRISLQPEQTPHTHIEMWLSDEQLRPSTVQF